jgi:hypothetical protein
MIWLFLIFALLGGQVQAATYALHSPAPSVTNVGVVTQGVSTAGYRTMWEDSPAQDGSGTKHMLAMWGGDLSDDWFGHYCNLSTGGNALVYGGGGTPNSQVYHPTQNKLYIGTHYTNCSLTEFDAVTKTATVIKSGLTTCCSLILGDDNLLYYREYTSNKVYSYDPSVGMPSGWKDYGSIDASAPPANYSCMGQVSGYVYSGVHYGDATWKLFVSPTSGSPSWAAPTGWTFNTSGDTYLTIYKEASPGTRIVCRRTLSDTSNKYYQLKNDGSVLEFTPGVNAGLDKEFPHYCTSSGTELDITVFPLNYNENMDFSFLFPIKDIYEQSILSYQVVGAGSWNTSTISFTGPWTSNFLHCVAPNIGTSVWGMTDSYFATVNLDYSSVTTTYLGAHILSPYGVMKHSSGEIYCGGYSNRVWRWDPTRAWTLTKANGTPTLPSDASRPNPYFMVLTTPLTHYRNRLDYDANGLVWIGGNTTRNQGGSSTFDIGSVMWYDPIDGSTSSGSLFPTWATTPGVKLGDLCAAANRSKICISDNGGNIYLIDAATKTVDPIPIVPWASNIGRWYMIEVANDVVLGVFINADASGVYKVCRFQPSTKTVLTAAQDLGVAGTPFGWTDGEANRKYYKLELGPDGYVWMFVGNYLCRINPTTCAFTNVLTASHFNQIKFAPNGKDVLLYGYDTNFEYYAGLLDKSGRFWCGIEALAKWGGVSNISKINGVQ